jgi:hypothetical protein
MVKSAVLLIAFFIFQAKAFSQTSRSVCNVTINEKPYFLSPEKDSLTKEEIVKGGKLLTPGNNYTIVSFQVTIRKYNDFGFIVFGSNLMKHYYADSFTKLEPGNKVLIECVQVKDKNGQKQVLQNRTFYIKAGPPKVETTTLK